MSHENPAVTFKCMHYFSMKDTVENKKVLVHEFASKLLRQQWNKLGTCDEVVLIVFSKEDGIVSLHTLRFKGLDSRLVYFYVHFLIDKCHLEGGCCVSASKWWLALDCLCFD